MRTRAVELNHDECLVLLGRANVGQLTMTRHAIPTAIPAQYVVRGDRVLIHLVPTLDRAPWNDGEVVGLHVYALDNNNGEGWTVSIVGRAHGTRDLRAVDVPPDIPWSIRGGGDLIELAAEIVRGERVAMVADDEDEDE